MTTVDSAQFEYPEWYAIEKNTEKIISRLITIKELSFYLSNPDEYIRRLAIIRMSSLKSKEFIDVLKELLDDPLESSLNKELSAWAIKVISLKCNTDIFINHKLLKKYNGDEKFNDIFKLEIIENLPSIRYSFTSGLVCSELQLDSSDILQSKDIVFDTHFNLLQWFFQCLYGKLEDLKIILLSLPANVQKLLKFALNQIRVGALFKVPEHFFLKTKNFFYRFSNTKTRAEEAKDLLSDFRSKHYSYYTKKTRRNVIEDIFKPAAISFLCFVFYPLRLILRHRFFSAVCLLIAYVYLTYSTSGKILTYKNFGVDLLDMQNHFLDGSLEILTFFICEINDIAEWTLSKFIE